MTTPITRRTAPLWKFAEVSPSTPEFSDLTESDEVTFIPLEDVWPTNKADDFQTVPWEKRLTGYTPFRCGDLLLPKVTPTVTHGRTMITDTATELGVASTEVYTVRTRPGTDPRWLAYLLVGTEFLGLAGASVQGTGGLKRISTQFLESYPLPDASPDEQRAIANYLDRETGEIDAMSADLDEMEALLKERMASIIDIAFAPSSTTETIRVGYMAELITGLTYRPEDVVDEGGTVVLRSGNIQNSRIDRADDLAVSSSVPTRLRVQEGDILVCARNGSADLVGKSARLTKSEVGLTWGAFMTVVRSGYNDWLYWYLRSGEFSRMRGDFSSSTINQLTNGTFSRLPVEVEKDPTRRQEIVQRLNRDTAEIDAMLSDITELRDLLTERRAAVIAAAVTGQIDVPPSKETAHA